MRVAIVGAGHMGQALASGLLTQGVLEPAELLLVDRDPIKQKLAKDSLGCQATGNLADSKFNAQCLILAVKPIDASQACSQLAALAEDTLVISVMAGTSIATLRKYLSGHRLIVRCMPNLAASLGRSITAYYCDSCDSNNQLEKKLSEKIETVLGVLGVCMHVNSEELVDAATAVSGSGPAYFFYFLEALIEAAQKLGFTAEQAHELVFETFSGAHALMGVSQLGPQGERERVTSKGGTTEAALAVLGQENFKGMLDAALQAAFKRARELSLQTKR